MNTIDSPECIAIVGLAGRFPQAAKVEEFWRNLREGREAITFFRPDEVQWLPFDHPPMANDPRFVRARAVLEQPEWFDAGFFNIKPREAAIMDPQHRLFLECAWEALENAGCNPDGFDGSIGVFAGSGVNTYLINNLFTNRNLVADFGVFAALTLNDKDYLATRVAYKLNLRGPGINVQTACSTSLVAVCLACQNLLAYHCDVALAGGVSVSFPSNRGHYHVEGGIMSRDGHCRAFDAKASGTVTGNGAGVVVLKRLSDALAAGDRICAVIKGHAVNNDGNVKMGFTAPSIEGQAECVATAQAMAWCDPGTISYIEAHGTGTPLGDPIEMAALTKAFGTESGRRGWCAVGSVKTNIGHLDVAAGVAGLIKTTLALQHRELPPSLHFEQPNPAIPFADGPFFVNDRLRPWPQGTTPRRAGVSSFGIGGTNAHVVLEEAPEPAKTTPTSAPQLLLLSARTPTALETATRDLARHLEQNPHLNLADVAFTLQAGRKRFEHRRAWVVDSIADAIAALRSPDGSRMLQGGPEPSEPKVVFMFPGQGAQALDMARELYEGEPVFRQQIDDACQLLRPQLGLDLRQVMFPAGDRPDQPGANGDGAPISRADAARMLGETQFTQPALFIIEYALATRWLRWGIRPAALIGHSLGEYVAACIAGVLTLPDALALVAERGRLMQAQPPGAMLAVRLAESRLAEWLDRPITLAAVNAPELSVVAGPVDAVEALERKLRAKEIPAKPLATSHAFHSAMMEPALPAFTSFLRRVVLRPPQIPWISNVTGTWITTQQATSPEYWARQLRHTVRFADGIGELARSGHQVFLEVGPGRTLSSLARQHPATAAAGATFTATLPPDGNATDRPAMLRALGQLWLAGVKPAWREGVHAGERRAIVALPTYPFERTKYWIEPGTSWTAPGVGSDAGEGEAHVPTAKPVVVAKAGATGPASLSAVRQVWCELSGVDLPTVAVDHTFAQLGFDSLFLTQACAAVSRRFGIEIAFRQLQDELSTLRKLAAYVDRHGVFAGPGVTPVAAEPAPLADSSRKRLPLTDAQREIWMVSQLGADASRAYTESATMEIRGPIDVAALGRAVQKLAARHEALRTTFEPDGEAQVITSEGTIELAFHDCRSEPAVPSERKGAGGALRPVARPSSDPAARADAWIEAALVEPFDLTRGPLFRPVLARIDDQTHHMALIVHHIVCDGWSLGILLRELADLYAAELTGGRPALPVAPRFTEYAEQQAAENRTSAFAAAEAYWREQFGDGTPVLELPTDRPRPANRSHAGDFVACTLPAGVTASVKRFAAERGTTVFTTLLAVFTVLLHRLAGQDDIVVGVPTAAQALDGHPDLVGHFANLLPIRSRIRDDRRFADHLADVQRAVSEALVHGQYPFVRLLQQLKLPRDASRVPLAPVIFNTTHHRGTVRFADATATLAIHPKRFVNFDLNFNLALTGDGLAFGCHYSVELFDRSTVTRWLAHFGTVLDTLLAHPDTNVATVPLLNPAERHAMVTEWNRATIDYRQDACIHHLFEEQARQTPGAIALVAGEERVRYDELDREADRMAAQLRAAGVKPDVPVGICLERTRHLFVAILAVLKAGGAYVPLDPGHPPKRIEYIVTDTRMPLIITQHSLLDVLPTARTRMLLVGDSGAAAPGGDMAPAAPRGETETATPKNLAYVIYTSGSTGQPKGICVPHRGVVALAAWARTHYKPAELAGVLFATAATFDVSVFEALVPLCLGGTVIIAGHILQLPYLPAAREVTLVSGVPSAVAELVRSRQIPESVRTINIAGEPCPQSLVEMLYALPQIEQVYDLYGPTETTVYSTVSLRRRGGRATIGRPLPNEQVYILDARHEPVPIGVHGELHIGGAKLARGYLGRPDLTAERFLELPFLRGKRLYRTGDRARYLPDGTIEYLGRIDHQVKLRGYRIELSEIETAVGAHPDVREIVAAVRPGPGGTEHLVGYVVPAPGRRLASAELREFARKWLPEPMVPTTFVVLEQFPRTSSGKVDRKALPAPVFDQAVRDDAAPRTGTEEAVAEIWCDVLGTQRVNIHDNFFALGGHSLHAMQVMARAHALFGVELTLREFFATPTVAGLAETVERMMVTEIKASAGGVARELHP